MSDHVTRGTRPSPPSPAPPAGHRDRTRRANAVPSILDGGSSAGGWTPQASVWQMFRQEPEVQAAGRVFGPALAILGLTAVVFPIPLGVYLYGAVLGGLGALVAVGMALVYRANRIVNFAQGHLGVTPAVVVVALLAFNDVPLPVAAAVGLVLAALLGALLDVVVIRRFRQAPRLVLTVATIGIAQLLSVTALGLPLLWDRTPLDVTNQAVSLPFRRGFEVAPFRYTADHVAAAVAVALGLLAVGAFLGRTRAGIAVRAAAERQDRASLLGIPVARLGTLVWVLATVLSFTGVLFKAAVVGSLPLNDPFLGFGAALAALAALMLGRLDDLPSIAASAVALGILEQAVIWNHGQTPELVYPVFALVVAGSLALRRVNRLRAGQDDVSSWQAAEDARRVPRQLRRLPEVRLARAGGLLVVLAAAGVAPLLLDTADTLKATAVVAFALVGLSVVLLTGWAGQISLGQMAFAGYGAGLGAVGFLELGWDATLVLPLAGIGGAGIAVLVGLPALRLRGIFLAAVTLAFSVASGSYLLSQRHLSWIPRGRIEQVTVFGNVPGTGGITVATPRDTYYLTLVATVLLFAAVAGVRRGRTGRVLVALRENELAAQSHGVALTQAKLTAFALSGGLASVAGCLYMLSVFGYSESLFRPTESLTVFTATVVGGMGSMLGAAIGALFLRGGAWFLTGNWVYVPSAVGVLVVLWLFPSGISGLIYRARDAALRVVARSRGLDVPALRADAGPVAAEPPPPPVGATVADVGAGAPRAHIRRGAGDLRRSRDVLEVRGLDVAYGNVQVLFGVDLTVAAGEVVALLGTNGAGKSTLLKAVSGLLEPSHGHVRLNGADITGASPQQIAARGVTQMPGGHAVFPSLTVEENLRMAAWLGRDESIDEALAPFPVLQWRLDDRAADLSGGQQQMLSLAMALLTRPTVMLIDELSLGLAPAVVGQLLEVVRGLAARGTAVVLVEQSVNVALSLAERAVFMEKGEVRFSGATVELLERPDLLRSVFLEGASAGLGPDGREPAPGAGDGDRPEWATASSAWSHLPVAADEAPTFELRGVSVSFGGIRAVDDVSLTVQPGEIVGLIGPNGAGKTTLFDVVSGVTPADRGLVMLDGVDVAGLGADERARQGLGRSFQDARLYPALTVEETLAVAFDRWVPAKDALRGALRAPDQRAAEAEVTERVDELIALLGLEPFRDKLVSELSTGSRRIVDLGCVLAHHPSVVLLDEPSSGIAQREAEALGPLLRQVRDVLGASMLLVEHDMGLASSLADRLVALDQGRIVAEGLPAEVLDHPAVVTSYLGGSSAAIHRSGPTPGATRLGGGGDGAALPASGSRPRHLRVEAVGADVATVEARCTGSGGIGSGGVGSGAVGSGGIGSGGVGSGGVGSGGVGSGSHGSGGISRSRRDRLRAYLPPIAAVLLLVVGLVLGGLGREPNPTASQAPTPAERHHVPESVAVPPTYPDADEEQRAATEWVANCDPGTGRISMPSVFAPPCVPAHTGDNGGATHPGVTADTVRLALYVPQEGDLMAMVQERIDPPEALRETRDRFMTMFGDLFETYGRDVELVEFDATGSMDDEVAARADAIRIAEEVEPFIVLGGPPLTTAFAEELANRGIICIGCGIAAPDSFHQDNAPFLWGPLPTPEEFLTIVGDFIFNRLQGHDAVHAGDPGMHDRERTFGIVRFEQRIPVFEDVARLARMISEANDLEYAADESYVFDLEKMPERATTIMAKMKAAGVTTVVFLGDPIMPIYLTQAATDLNYFPEWVVTGTVLSDTTTMGRLYDQAQWANAFGMSPLPVQTPLEQGEAYRLHEWHFGEPPAASRTSQIIYQGIFHAYLGIHMAGPDLTPASFRDGLFNYPPSGGGPTNPRISFGRNRLFISESLGTRVDYLGVDDMVEIWWDPAAEGTDETGTPGRGMWRYANGGRRYLPGDMPAEPTDAFRGDGSVLLYEDHPEDDRPPDYPPPDADRRP